MNDREVEEATMLVANEFKYDSTVSQLWLGIHKDEQGEGLVSFKTPGGFSPLVCTSEKVLPTMKAIADEIAKQSGRPVIIKRFVEAF